ncbi:sigma-70 family RNA polymerase sigma factor [Bacillus massiliigorillae]|uniref:sigma-70 family RNA polymerase sigma factor n=1 Tax=Bacillus massiliigorillae TaxID=1243664 RepID=UPI0005AAE194|nr:sigma-70 family RNA polymerase sigma factor [Bacillus massiliigorillae]
MNSFDKLVSQHNRLIYKIIHSLKIYKEYEYYYNIGLQALWEASLKFDGKSAAFTTFAYSVIKGRILNELRLENKWEVINQLPIVEPHFFNTLQYDTYLEKESILHYCNGLTLNQKRWVIHTFIDHETLNEIARRYSVNTCAVKSWRRDALKKLKKQPHTSN